MDYEKKQRGDLGPRPKRPEDRPLNADRDRERPGSWRPSDAPQSPTRVGVASTPGKPQDPQP